MVMIEEWQQEVSYNTVESIVWLLWIELCIKPDIWLSCGRDCLCSVLYDFVLLGNALNSFYSSIYLAPSENLSFKNYSLTQQWNENCFLGLVGIWTVQPETEGQNSCVCVCPRTLWICDILWLAVNAVSLITLYGQDIFEEMKGSFLWLCWT